MSLAMVEAAIESNAQQRPVSLRDSRPVRWIGRRRRSSGTTSPWCERAWHSQGRFRPSMKFADGYWLTRPDFTVLRPVEVAEVSTDGTRVSVLAGTKPPTGRGWDLNLASATITLSAPMLGVVSVRIEHHRGARNDGPHFELPGATVVPAQEL